MLACVKTIANRISEILLDTLCCQSGASDGLSQGVRDG
jgi:hypothetical protein